MEGVRSCIKTKIRPIGLASYTSRWTLLCNFVRLQAAHKISQKACVQVCCLNPKFAVPSRDEKVLVVVSGVMCESKTLRLLTYAQDLTCLGARAKTKA